MKLRHTLFHYAALGIILVGGVWSFITLKGNQSAQLFVGIVMAVAYALWGILYHTTKKDIHQKVVVEYVLVSAIAILVLMIVLRY